MLKNLLASIFLVSMTIFGTESQDGTSDVCILPPFPKHGSYIVRGHPTAAPGQTFNTARLNVTCHPGYKAVGKSIVLCLDGFWSENLPECVRSCRLDKHPSVSYRCVINGNYSEEGYRDCDLHEIVGTKVKPECNAPNYYRSGVLSYMRCTNNGWDYVAVCTPECGTITSKGKEQVVGGRPAKHGELPWHAGIYTKTNTPYKQICGGSLVSTTVVISAGHCFFNKQEERLYPASRYGVAVGKRYRPWGDSNDVDAQRSDVKEIKTPERFQGAGANFQDDLAVVVLVTTIVYQTYVRPVCVDFNKIFERRQLQPGTMGKVAGWGLIGSNGPASPVLNVLDTPYVDIAQCYDKAPAEFKQFITSDKICAGHTDGKAVCEGDSGGGLVFPAVDRGVERYYLRGVVSTAPTSGDDACNAFAITTYTRITAHSSFIEENVVLFHGEVPNASDSKPTFCILPSYPNHGAYVIKGESVAYPGQAFVTAQLDVICEPGYRPEENVTLYCSEGRWSNDFPRCVRLCKLTRHPSVNYRCLTNNKGDSRECKDEEPNGLTIKPECKPGYFSRHELPLMKCIDGSWYNNPICKSDCGKISAEFPDRVPWQVTVYDTNFTQKNPSCDGSLVTKTAVISGYTCFWKYYLGYFGEAKLGNTYAVAVGNRHRRWMHPSDTDAQTSFLTDIYFHERSDGNPYYLYSISVLILETPIMFTAQVSPVCLDFDIDFDRKQLQHGNKGKIFTWNTKVKEDWTTTSVTKSYLDNFDCNKRHEKLYLTADMDCAVSTGDNSSSLCSSNQGAGFVVADADQGGDRYYLRGVLNMGSTSPNYCAENHTVGITRLQLHDDFIRKYIILD